MTRNTLASCLTAILIATAVIGHAIHQRVWLHPHDDQMYLFSIAARSFDPPRHDRVVEEARRLVQERAETPWLVTRFELRDAYSRNYAGFSYLAGRIASALQPVAPIEAGAYAHWVALTMSLNAALVAGLAFVVVLIALLMARDTRLLAAAAVVGLIVVYEGLIDLGSSDRLLPSSPGIFPEPFDLGSRLIRMVIDPGESTYLFGAAPRCMFALMLLASFVFRWQGRPALAYWLFVPMTMLHQSQAGMFLPMLVALDLILRPRELVRPGALSAIGVTLAMFVMRERLWAMAVGATALVLATFVLAAVLIAAFVLRRWFWERYRSIFKKALRWRRWLLRRSPPVADAVLLLAGWSLLFVLTAIGNYVTTREHSTFFWNHIAGRIFGTIRPEILIAVVYVVLARLAPAPEAHARAKWGVAALALLLVPAAILAWPPAVFSHVVERNTASVLALEARMAPPVTTVNGTNEDLIYYAIGKSVATGRDEFARLR